MSDEASFLEPGPELTPQEVIQIGLHALKHNDVPRPDTGIEIAYDFASPANKAMTGPLHRFKEMVKNPMYRPLLNFRNVEYGRMEIKHNHAQQIVQVVAFNGEIVHYYFALSRQTEAPCKGWWMIDSVLRVG